MIRRWVRGEIFPTVEIRFGIVALELVFPFWKIVALAALAVGWLAWTLV
jgi:hypothetical protein